MVGLAGDPGVLPLAAEKLGYQLCPQTLYLNAVTVLLS